MTIKTVKPPMSKMRSIAQAAICEEKVRLVLTRDQVGTNQFSRPSQQSQAGEPDQRRRNQTDHRKFACALDAGRFSNAGRAGNS